MSYSYGRIPPIALAGGLAFVAILAIVLINPSALPFGAAGTTYCASVASISPQLEYKQITGLPTDILDILDPSANTLGVFRGSLNFIGGCQKVNAYQKTDGDNTANVKDITATLTKLTCDYTLSQPYQQVGKQAKSYYKDVSISYSSIALSSCVDELTLQGKNPFAGVAFSTGAYVPDGCMDFYRQACRQNSGYDAYFSNSFKTIVGGIGKQRQAVCAKTVFEGSGSFYSSTRTGTFKPNAAVTISYGNEVITLDTTSKTIAPTTDHKAVFQLSQTTGSFAQDCPNNAYVYYKDEISKYYITEESMDSAKAKYDIVLSTKQRDLDTYNREIQEYNTALNSLVLVNVTSLGQVAITNAGQTVSINRITAPNVNPVIDFWVVAERVSVTSYVANPSFVSTNPPAGTSCLSTTSQTQTQVSARLSSQSKGQVTVNVICDSPLGHKESEQILNFQGGDTLTATFNAYVPQNNYTCHFYAYNWGLGGKTLVKTSDSFCVQSTQVVYEDCKSLYGFDTLKVPDQNTGKCICPYTQTTGQTLCGTGSTFSLSQCKCAPQQAPSPGLCLLEPTSCPTGYVLKTGANGCKECVTVTCANQPTSCPENYALAKDANGCNICTPKASVTCQAQVDAITCNNLDFACQINKSVKSISCLVEQINEFMSQLFQNILLLGAFCCGGIVLLALVGVGSFSAFKRGGIKLGRRR